MSPPGVVVAVVSWIALAIVAPAAEVAIEGSVAARRPGELRVDFTPQAGGAPAPGDAVAFITRIDTIDVASGAGEVTSVDAGQAWVRITEGRPDLGHAARIQATGRPVTTTPKPAPSIPAPKPAAPAMKLERKRAKGLIEMDLPEGFDLRVIRDPKHELIFVWHAAAFAKKGPLRGTNVTIRPGLLAGDGLTRRSTGIAMVIARQWTRSHGGKEEERWDGRPVPGSECHSSSYDVVGPRPIRVWSASCPREWHVDKYGSTRDERSRHVLGIDVVVPRSAVTEHLDGVVERMFASLRQIGTCRYGKEKLGR